ncbi:MAG: class I SAM-dependent methyltransferase [Treponema sp.]|nr:class I SAM-dependent methyltransferase [Treponema sp.]
MDFFLRILRERFGDAALSILEVACGAGRLAVPLAQDGHSVTGIDADEHMLLRCYARARGMPRLRLFQADAIRDDWGQGFDLALIGGNFLINIETEGDYEEAQKALFVKAAQALKPGGFLLMDFDMSANPAKIYDARGERSGYRGTDDLGTSGRQVSYGGVYNPVTRICVGSNHRELATSGGESFALRQLWRKHIPSREQVWQWCAQAGFSIEKAYKNFTTESVPDPLDDDTRRVTLLAKKKC